MYTYSRDRPCVKNKTNIRKGELEVLFMSIIKEEYDLLADMIFLFRQLGGDAIKWSLPAFKCMSDECTSFSDKQLEADNILLNFICELTKSESTISIDETEDALYKGVLLSYYCLLKKHNDQAILLIKYIRQKAEMRGYTNLLEIIKEVEFLCCKKGV